MKFSKFIIITILFISQQVLAQDIIVLRDGDIIQSKVQEITPTEVKYKKYSNLEGPLYTIEKSTVLSINYENGDKDKFESKEITAKIISPNVEAIGLPDEENNSKLINEMNNSIIEFMGGEGAKNDKARAYICKLSATLESQLANKDVELSLFSEGVGDNKEKYKYAWTDRWISIELKNKTDKTIYVDLSSSFFKRGTEGFALYVPTATSNTKGNTTGASVNLGNVADAVGVGGVVGTIAGGVNVGGFSSNSNTTVTYAQRVVAIPPMSTKQLAKVLIFPKGCEAYYKKMCIKKWTPYVKPAIKIESKRGEILSFDISNSPLNCGTFITYSFDDKFSYKATINVDLYVSHMYGGKLELFNKEYFKREDYSTIPESMLFFIGLNP